MAALKQCYDGSWLMWLYCERVALRVSKEERRRPGSQSSVDRSDSTRQAFHARRHSDFSVPHLMRDGDMDGSNLDIGVDVDDDTATPNFKDPYAAASRAVNEIGSADCADMLSAPSPAS